MMTALSPPAPVEPPGSPGYERGKVDLEIWGFGGPQSWGHWGVPL